MVANDCFKRLIPEVPLSPRHGDFQVSWRNTPSLLYYTAKLALMESLEVTDKGEQLRIKRLTGF